MEKFSANSLWMNYSVTNYTNPRSVQMSVAQHVCRVLSLFVLCAGVMGFGGQTQAAGLLTPQDGSLPALDIKEHDVKVVIEDGYAVTTVEQVFSNPHRLDLEATYSFPVPEQAAVSEFTMWIDGQPIHGEVLERKAAREVYEEQKAQNQQAGLTEKNESKTFEISVFPVRAGQTTRIRLGYIQPAHVDTNIGRYVYPLEEGGVDEQALAFWTVRDAVTERFSFDLVLRSAYPVDELRLPSHPQAQIRREGDAWIVHLDNLADPVAARPAPAEAANADTAGGASPAIDPSVRLTTDIVVYYRHAEGLPGSVDLVAYRPDPSARGTFMMTVTPGMDLQPITEGRDWLFVLDTSGSMQGKYSALAEGVSQALQRMSAEERFRIVLFNDGATELTQGWTPASPANVQEYIGKVSQIQPDHSTNLYAGLQMGLRGLDADRTSSIILVTDGVANVGVTEQKRFVELIKRYDVRLFTFIMGNSANTPLLESITDASHGLALTVSNSDDIIGKILLAKSKVTHQSLHGVQVKISGVKTSDLTPRNIGSLYRGQQLVILGHYVGDGPATVTLSGKISGEDKVYTTTFDFPAATTANPELERLWAFAAIEALTREMEHYGETADIKQSITDLGVEYGLVTDYTSMVVVEEEVFKRLGIDRNNTARIEREHAARLDRARTSIQRHRVDTHQPMFQHNRPTSSGFNGGLGAFDPVSVLVLSPLLFGLRRRRKQQPGDDVRC